MSGLTNTELFSVDPEIATSLHELSNEDLCSFAELHEDPAKDEQIELYICTCFLIFEKTCSTKYLEQAIQRTEGWIAAIGPEHPDRARRLRLLDMMSARFIDQSVSQAPMSDDMDIQILRKNDQAIRLLQNYKRTGIVEELDRAIIIMEQVIDATSQESIYLASMLSNLGTMLRRRFERTDSTDDLNRAVDVAEMTVKATPQDHPDRAIRLNNLANWLGIRFEQTSLIDDLNRTIDIADMAVNTAQDHPYRAGFLSNLGNWLGTRFERTGSTDDLNYAVKVADMAVDSTPQDSPERASRLNNLGNLLGRRFQWTSSIDNLNRAIDVTDMAVNATQDHSDRAAILNNLGNWLGMRFEWTSSVDDLNRALNVTNIVVNATPQDHPDRASRLSNLGNLLGRRSECYGLIDDLNRAVNTAEMAVNATPQDYPDRAGILNNLGSWLGKRFEWTDSIDDLNHAVDVTEMAVNATPLDYPDRAGYLINLGSWLGMRFERTDSMDDLNHAVDVADMAVDSTPQDHSERASRLNSLGNLLSMLFERTSSMDSLNRAVDVAEMAVNATAQDHSDWAGRLNNFGNLLSSKFERTGSIDNLNRAIDIADMAVNATPQDHPYRASRLNNFGNRLGRRSEQTQSIADLNRAVDVADIVVNLTPQDHPDRAGYLNNLGSWLSMRFKRTGSIDDLNRAVDVADMAVNATPQDHRDRAGYLDNLGNWLSMRSELNDSRDDLNHALSYFKEGWACHRSPPSVRVHLAWRVANILASQLNWEESSNFLEGAVKLLPIVSPRLLDNSDKQHILEGFAGLASMAAAVSLEAGKDEHYALELLELGRCVIAGLLLEMRTEVSDLKQQHSVLAAEFESLRDKLDSPSSGTTLLDTIPSSKFQANRRLKADQEFAEVIKKIRDQPGFQNFLLPPTYDDLIAATDQGPIVIINVSSYRCDAFLVEHHGIRVLPLPNLRMEELNEKVQQLLVGSISILQWLWDVAAGPILDALGYQCLPSDNNLPHVWWIPTGVLSHFPIHGAGLYTKGSTNTVLDRVMSSYSSSIKALVFGRGRSVRKPSESTPKHALLVAMRHTPGHRTLPFANKEVEMLANLCPSLQLKPVMSLQRREEVLAHLQTCEIFHFAGHGRSDLWDPSRSCLLLDD
jgi:tetratricopeptide (TPR) repeat protein